MLNKLKMVNSDDAGIDNVSNSDWKYFRKVFDKYGQNLFKNV